MRFNPELISGKVTDLVINRDKMNLVNPQTTNTAAAGAAAAGEVYTASTVGVGSMLNTEGIYFSFKLNGIQISGGFLGLGIQEGDVVDVVVTLNPNNEHEATAYLVRLPSQRKIWTAFGYSYSDIKGLIFNAPGVILAVFLPLSVLIKVAIDLWNYGNLDLFINGWREEVLVFIMSGFFLYLVMSLGVYVMYGPKARKSAKIFEVLGYENPKDVVLEETDHEYRQQWEKEHGEPFQEEDEFVYYY